MKGVWLYLVLTFVPAMGISPAHLLAQSGRPNIVVIFGETSDVGTSVPSINEVHEFGERGQS